jgi:hypothetical protein
VTRIGLALSAAEDDINGPLTGGEQRLDGGLVPLVERPAPECRGERRSAATALTLVQGNERVPRDRLDRVPSLSFGLLAPRRTPNGPPPSLLATLRDRLRGQSSTSNTCFLPARIEPG